MDDETKYHFFHGTQLDMDIDKLLQSEGDYLVQAKHIAGCKKAKLFLVVKGAAAIHRVEMRRNESLEIRLLAAKIFKNMQQMVDYHLKVPLEVKGEKLILKNGVSRGKFQMYHHQIRLHKKCLGKGSYGVVYRGLLARENTTIAVKKLDSEGTDDNAIAEMMKEARVMQLYDHKNIVKFYGFIVDRQPYLLVMEFCDGGAVEDKLMKHGQSMSVNMRVDMCAQAATGLEYLHSKECIHRDIAARNCLINKGVVKMADFGMCRPTSVYKVDPSKPCNVRWLAPEVWKIGETRYNTDIYAFGVMLWEMFIHPYDSPYNAWKAYKVKQEVMKGYRLPPPDNMPKELASVMAMAWNHEPEKRPDAVKLRKEIEKINQVINPNGFDVNAARSRHG